MKTVNQYQCDFCKQIYISDKDALACEQRCSEKSKKAAEQTRKAEIIKNKKIELDKLTSEFVKEYGYSPSSIFFKTATESKTSWDSKPQSEVIEKTFNSIGDFLEFIDKQLTSKTSK